MSKDRKFFEPSNINVVGPVLLALAKDSKGLQIGRHGRELYTLLNNIPEARDLKGWGLGSSSRYKHPTQHAWKQLRGLSEHPKIRVSRNPDVFVRVCMDMKSSRLATVVVCDIAGNEQDVKPRLGLGHQVGEAPGTVLRELAKVCHSGKELSFDSWGNQIECVLIWDVLNGTPAGYALDGWGRGNQPKFGSGAKVHIHNKLKRLSEYTAVKVSANPSAYIYVREVPIKKARVSDWDTIQTTFNVRYCTKAGKEIRDPKAVTAAIASKEEAMNVKAPPYVRDFSQGRFGHVYALINPSMPGLFKVGRTTSDPATRAKDLSRGTNMPTPFDVHSYVRCDDCVRGEKQAHEALVEFRISEKEFFRASEDQILEVLGTVGRESPIVTGKKLILPPKEKAPAITQEMVLGTFVAWAKEQHEMSPGDIVLSKRDQCARLRIGTYGSEDDWVTVPFGSFANMSNAVDIHVNARNEVLKQYASI